MQLRITPIEKNLIEIAFGCSIYCTYSDGNIAKTVLKNEENAAEILRIKASCTKYKTLRPHYNEKGEATLHIEGSGKLDLSDFIFDSPVKITNLIKLTKK